MLIVSPVIAAAATTLLWLGLPSASRSGTGANGIGAPVVPPSAIFIVSLRMITKRSSLPVLADQVERPAIGVGQLLGAEQDLLQEAVVVALRRQRDAELDQPPVSEFPVFSR